MKRIFLSLLAFLVFASFITVPETLAQEPPTDIPTVERIFASFSQSTATLKKKVDATDVKNQTMLNQVDESVNFLRGEVTVERMGPVPEAYLKSLALDAELLNSLAERKKATSLEDRSSLAEGLQNVADDLATKVGHLKQPRRGPTLVEVTVRARTSGKEVDDCEVWYVPKGWFNYPNVHTRFDRLTNQARPPKMFLAPGNYFIWLTKPPVKTERQPMTIGGDGSSRREIELLIP